MESVHFNGPDYDPEKDKKRLIGQQGRIKVLMLDGRWRTLQEIKASTGDPESSISAQLRHLRKMRFGSHYVDKRRRGTTGSWEYKVYPAGTNDPVINFPPKVVSPLTAEQAQHVRADFFAMRQLAHRQGFEFRYRDAAKVLFLYLEEMAGDKGKICPDCSRVLGRTYEGMWCPVHGVIGEDF